MGQVIVDGENQILAVAVLKVEGVVPGSLSLQIQCYPIRCCQHLTTEQVSEVAAINMTE
eukprot:CAMPEP_0178432078 /NCGR_PEP_ID=MMETSP0689_2-20121128/32192_1 /TAXON_ID=160604 /ORGANISM="Amphidinium massartii, Strain CS-259" /LENGTH=58 /DNA_ID=CAMNT_0020054039 /DNA_START=137 /DNA_END=313 /DNA_ORIENTATION=+